MIPNHRLSEFQNDSMTPNTKRRKYISDLVARHGYARVTDLAENLGVTTVTIRTDLKYLEDKGVLIRSHGGAITSTSTVRDLKEDIKKKANAVRKGSCQTYQRKRFHNNRIRLDNGRIRRRDRPA